MKNSTKQINTEEWKSRVYHERVKNHGLSIDEWELVRDSVLKRDKYTCYRCDKTLEAIKLSVHHVVPRSKGGSNELNNLITLCNPCHDLVEMNEYKSLAEIIGSYKEDGEDSEKDYSNDWRAWVYGGMKSPR